MSQPKWKFLANLGDVGYLDYGGYFIYKDETGVYEEEAEYLELNHEGDENTTYTVYRIILEKCTFINGVLSDNSFHPEHPVWWKVNTIASFADQSQEELIADFCSDDPLKRAQAYRSVAEYHGWDEFDQYPIKLTHEEAEQRYKETKHGSQREPDGTTGPGQIHPE